MAKLLTALAAAAVLLTAAPAFAKMECQGSSCVDKALIRERAIQLYCNAHPGDPDCQALGWRYNSTDPIEQAIDRRMVEYECRARPYTWACVSPFKPAPAIPLEPERR